MKRIGLLSDTHHFIHPATFRFFDRCDEIWHAGDIGSIEIADQLAAFKPLRAVYGNIDGADIRLEYPEIQVFTCESVKVLIKHIGGYPGRYAPGVKELLVKEKPKLFVSGHSHILKAMPDKKFGLLHLNPGAAGKQGLHKHITMMRFSITYDRIQDLEIKEIKRKSF